MKTVKANQDFPKMKFGFLSSIFDNVLKMATGITATIMPSKSVGRNSQFLQYAEPDTYGKYLIVFDLR